MKTEPPEEPPGGGSASVEVGGHDASVGQMRAALRSRIGKRLDAGVRRWSPEALMAALAASAYAPMLVAGNTESALVVTGAAGASVGANVISDILQKGVGRLRRHKLTVEELEDWLQKRFEELLAAEGRRATVLQGQLAVIFSRIGAAETALEAAVEAGGRALRTEVAAGLAQLDAQFHAVSAGLGVIDVKIDEIRRDVGALRHAVNQQQAPAPVWASAPVGVPLIRITDPFALEVHHAIDMPKGAVDDNAAEAPVLPAYVERDHDRILAKVVTRAIGGESSIAVLVGGSSTGKTRACWEALHRLREHPEPWRLWHPIDPTRPEAALADLARVGPHTVLWLNEAQFYLNTGTAGLGERLAAGVRELLRDTSRGPVLMLATLWPVHWAALTTRTESDLHAQARELLEGHGITVPEAFTGTDIDGLNAKSGQDLRLSEAADGAQDGKITQYLAGVPVLMDRYDKAQTNPATAALIHTAMDARRLGCGPHLPLAFLAAAAPGYLTEAEWDQTADDWLQAALDYTATPCNGIPGILSPIKPGSNRNRRPAAPGPPPQRDPGPTPGPYYRLADYLDQHGRRYRAERIPPIGFWTAATQVHPSDQAALGNAAWNRGLYRDATQLHKNAATYVEAATALVDHVHQLHPADQRPAKWAVSHVTLEDPRGMALLLEFLRKLGAEEQVAMLLARDPASHIAVDYPVGVSWLLEVLRELGPEERVMVLAERAAAQVSLDDPIGVRRLMKSLRLVGAEEQVMVLAERAATHVSLDDSAGVGRLLEYLHVVGAEEQVMVLAERAAAQLSPDRAASVGRLLEYLHVVGAEEQVMVLAERAAAHVSLHPIGVGRLLESLHVVGAEEQVMVLAERAAAHVSPDDPADVRMLLKSLHVVGAEEQVMVLARRAAAHVSLGDPNGVRWLVSGLRELGAEEMGMMLAERAAAHVSLNHPARVSMLLEYLHAVGADEQVTVLLARDPATYVDLGDPYGVGSLLGILKTLGAEEQLTVLLARDPATYVDLGDPYGVRRLVSELRELGAEEMGMMLAERAAAHVSLNHPARVSMLLDYMRELGAEELGMMLAERAAAHVSLDDPADVSMLVYGLQELGAEERVIVLARRAAAHVSLGDPRGVRSLLETLHVVGAEEQVTVLLQRLPTVGRFAEFIKFGTNRERYAFGREPDGSAAAAWTWDDLI